MSDYTPSGAPATSSSGDSATIRAEFSSIQTAVNSKVDENGALGTPTSGTLTNCTGLPAAGVTGTALVSAAIGTTVQAYDADLTTWAGVTPGTGIATALAVNVGTAGAPVINGGALGTPSSGIGTNLTGTASGLTAGNVTTNANLTGHVTSTGNAAVLGSFTHAQLNTAVSDANLAASGANSDITSLTAVTSINTHGFGSVQLLENGGFDIWQRGTSFANPSNAYMADCWAGNNNNVTMSQVAAAALYGVTYYMRATTTNATNSMDLTQALRAESAVKVAGKNATFSINAQCSTGTVSATLRIYKNSTPNTFTGGSWSEVASQAIVITTANQSFSVTGAIPSDGTAAGLKVSVSFSNAANGITIDFYTAQLEPGSVASTFEIQPYETVEARCLKHYWRTFPQVNAAPLTNNLYCFSTTQAYSAVKFPVKMWKAPAALEQSGTAADYRLITAGTAIVSSAVPTFTAATTEIASVTWTVAAGLTVGQAGFTATAVASSAAYLGWSADL